LDVAKPLVVVFEGEQIALGLQKVERSDLYGDVEIESVDPQGRSVTLASLDGDGQTLVGSGGTAFAYLDSSRRWTDKSALRRTTLEGVELQPVPSSFSAPVEIAATATIDEYLTHNIRAIYRLDVQEGDASVLQTALKSGAILTFPFSYRGGIDPDVAFLLNNAAGETFLALGKPAAIDFLGFDQAVAPLEVEEDVDDAEEIDFGMM
jgi:hypothetical protein